MRDCKGQHGSADVCSCTFTVLATALYSLAVLVHRENCGFNFIAEFSWTNVTMDDNNLLTVFYSINFLTYTRESIAIVKKFDVEFSADISFKVPRSRNSSLNFLPSGDNGVLRARDRFL